ncbi:MAG TPA: NHLP-related RiPP peptide [Rhodanobacteraceae bacterium]|nr:NHLP-related RiPP peptide [Rhodanobacteraceae bacterium]
MANPSLTRQQALTLLNKLGTDDSFRQRFENSPRDALTEVGVPQDKVATFPVESLAPVKLASKEKFRELHDQISRQPTTEWMCMIIPQFRIDK